jgi:hypothetical protein
MAVYLIDENNKPHKAHYVSVLTEPSSYQMTATPEEMQRGTTAIVKGKIVEGTGKCFAFVVYGQESVYPIFDEQGNERYGLLIEQSCNINMFFISSTTDSDAITQDVYIIKDIQEGEAVRIGENKSTHTGIFAFQIEGALIIYGIDISNANTSINYFVGRDNKI